MRKPVSVSADRVLQVLWADLTAADATVAAVVARHRVAVEAVFAQAAADVAEGERLLAQLRADEPGLEDAAREANS